MDTPIPEFLAEAANRRVSDIFIIAGRPLAEKIDGHLLDRGDRLMPDFVSMPTSSVVPWLP